MKNPYWDGKIHRPAKAGEGFRWDTADGAQRREQIERHHRRAAQTRYEEERDRVEVKEPTFIGRIWEKSGTSSSRQGVDPDDPAQACRHILREEDAIVGELIRRPRRWPVGFSILLWTMMALSARTCALT